MSHSRISEKFELGSISKTSTQPISNILQGFQLQLYQIEVKNQGNLVAEHCVAANSALEAINLIEGQYGEPVQTELIMIEEEDGSRRQIMIAKNWHGYMFDARAIGPPANNDLAGI